MLITFEGIDGGGKSTHMKATAAFLRSRGVDVLATREPGGTEISEQIRTILMDHKNKSMTPPAELLLFSASRAQLVNDVIRPQLARGGVVLLDRFYDSTFAYQGYGHGLDIATLRIITHFATGGLTPDLTLFLDLSPEVALNRRYAASLFGEEFNRLDASHAEFRQRVVEGYRILMDAEPHRFVRIDAEQNLQTVQASVIACVAQALKLEDES